MITYFDFDLSLLTICSEYLISMFQQIELAFQRMLTLFTVQNIILE